MEIEVWRSKLVEEQRALLVASDGSSDSRAPVILDQQSVGRLSRMDAMQQQAMAQASERRRQLRLERIKAALKRIEDGAFGFCVECEEAIALPRLESDPTTPTCIRCAAAR